MDKKKQKLIKQQIKVYNVIHMLDYFKFTKKIEFLILLLESLE